MRQLLPLGLALMWIVPLWAAPSTRHEGARWVLENAVLRVEVDADRAALAVLDKTSGYLWRGPDAPAVVTPTLKVLPVAGAQANLDATACTEGQPPTSRADLSGVVELRWSDQGLHLLATVADQYLDLPAADETQWWEKDSVEFWVGARQYAIRGGDWGANLWVSGGAAEGAQAAWERTEQGYRAEVFLPAAILPGLAPGNRFPFAVGVNDSDGAGRARQLYYPRGWQHSNTDTFVTAILANAQGEVPATPVINQPALKPVSGHAAPGTVSFTTTVQSAGQDLPLTVTLALQGDAPDLVITLDTVNRDTRVDTFGVFKPLVLDRPGGRILCAQYCDGIGVRTDDMAWRGRTWGTPWIDMPWVGLTDGEIGYLLQWDLPTACDYGLARLEAVKVGDQTLLAPAALHMPIQAKFGKPRTYRYSFCATGGHVSICKRYRAYLKANGMLVTQYEKLERKPHLARLLGAPDVWGRADLTFCQEAKAAGIDRMLINGPSSREDMEKIKALGYLISVYDNYEDAHEGDSGVYGDFDTERDAVMNADGSLMTAWVTHDDPPKQFMKRCSALYEQVARKWVPRDLEQHPYNARFLDVTTATGLRDCYHPNHPQDFTQDRLDNRRLAKYIGDELGLVLGGEHGRWWGADIYNYWEGMQSGGFYSWPAGYVGEDIPQTPEEIGKEYLEWGLGEANRYPLWELVFHDCVVSTWYWGDSTGHLRVAAPDLGHKQDVFNILYGTVPLYWVNQPYSYNWSDPELRARLLESYRITCKPHEVIGFQEMTGHRFITEDRAVQKSAFADGTVVWVNFGAKPYTLELPSAVGRTAHQSATSSVTLPQYGFYLKGPKIEQYRVLQRAGEGHRTVTSIRTPGYLHVEGSIPGLVETSSGAAVTLRTKQRGLVYLNAAPGADWVRINTERLYPEAGKGTWRLAPVTTAGSWQPFTAALTPQNGLLTVALGGSPRCLLVGPSALAARAELAIVGDVTVTPPTVRQGTPVRVNATLRNYGGRAASRVKVTVKTDAGPVAAVLGTAWVDVKPYSSRPVALDFDTTRRDGPLAVFVTVDSDARFAELVEEDNRRAATMTITPDWSRWESFVDLQVTAQGEAGTSPVVRLPFDAAAERSRFKLKEPVNPASLRVVVGEVSVPAQLVPGTPGTELAFVWPGALPAGPAQSCRLYMDGGNRHEPRGGPHWDAANSRYLGPLYQVNFEQGAITSLAMGSLPLLSYLQTSSGDTGWVIEQSNDYELTVIADGSVCTIIEVRKRLPKGHSYHKRYEFFPDFFTVTTLSPERYGTMSRAYYVAKGQIEDDKGNKATIDGQGDAEDFSGKNSSPKWYATWDQAANWALNAVAVTPHDGLGYWDAGNMAGVGFTTGDPAPATVAYFLHREPFGSRGVGSGFDPVKQAEADYQRAHTTVKVTR